MADVAAAAGVSHQTVSRVLNGHEYVRAETRERVQAAIDALGYRRNQAARTLVTRRSATIGLVTTGTTHFGPSSAALAIEEAARDAGLFVSIAALPSPDAAAAARVFDQLMAQGVDGVIVVAPLVAVAQALDDVTPPVPVVVVAARRDVPAHSSVRYVAVDQHAGAAEVVDHLVSLGRDRIAHIHGPDTWFDALERARGFGDAVERAGARGTVVRADGWGAEDGHRVGRELVRGVRAGEITAVAAANDYLALGALRAFAEEGIRVPDDVAVAGFDDIDGSGFLVPSLTTVRQPFARLGAVALRAAGCDEAPVAALAPELVVRESSGE